jgi:hypothetical protein
VHAFVGAILLGGGGANALVLDPQPHPPDVELREAMDAAGGEGHPVVGPDRPREAELAEGVLEDGPRPAALDVGKPPTREQVAGVLVADGEGIAPHGVLGGELALEVGRPQVVGGRGHRGHDTRMLPGAAAPAFLHQAFAGEQVSHGAHGRPSVPGDLGMPRPDPVEQLAWPPVGMGPPRLAQELGELLADAVRTAVRGVAAVPQAAASIFGEPPEPFVARLPADAVAGTQLRSGVEATPIVGDEVFALVHGCRLQPGHRPTFPPTGWTCSLSEVSPIIPVWSVTNQPGLHQPAA